MHYLPDYCLCRTIGAVARRSAYVDICTESTRKWKLPPGNILRREPPPGSREVSQSRRPPRGSEAYGTVPQALARHALLLLRGPPGSRARGLSPPPGRGQATPTGHLGGPDMQRPSLSRRLGLVPRGGTPGHHQRLALRAFEDPTIEWRGQILQSEAESQRIAVRKLLSRLQHPGWYVSRLQTIRCGYTARGGFGHLGGRRRLSPTAPSSPCRG